MTVALVLVLALTLVGHHRLWRRERWRLQREWIEAVFADLESKLAPLAPAFANIGITADQAAETTRAFGEAWVEAIRRESTFAIDRHRVVHDDAEPDERCWATVGSTDCGREATSPVGLCDEHLAELRGDQRRADAPTSGVEWVEVEGPIAVAMPAGRARSTVIVQDELTDREGGV